MPSQNVSFSFKPKDPKQILNKAGLSKLARDTSRNYGVQIDPKNIKLDAYGNVNISGSTANVAKSEQFKADFLQTNQGNILGQASRSRYRTIQPITPMVESPKPANISPSGTPTPKESILNDANQIKTSASTESLPTQPAISESATPNSGNETGLPTVRGAVEATSTSGTAQVHRAFGENQENKLRGSDLIKNIVERVDSGEISNTTNSQDESAAVPPVTGE
ncbi:MAG: hypothetical protein Q7S37_04335 [bacterium]|nr:hypothetical protein [bacterium]